MKKLFKGRKFFSKGFSLTELSVSLVIVGTIAASAISMAVSNDRYNKTRETNDKMDRIEEALTGFVTLNLRMPCPADGTLAITNASFGLEGTPTTTSCPNANFNYGANGTKISGGVVPVRSLQLPDDYMFDGWGRRFTYVVNVYAANNVITNTNCYTDYFCFVGVWNMSITINFAGGSTSSPQDIIYVLMSHGENGHGAYPKNGGSTRVNGFPVGNPYRSGSAAELENGELDTAGSATAFDNIFVQKDFVKKDDTTLAAGSREYFDDIVRYKDHSQIVYSTGNVWYNLFCPISKIALETQNTSSNDCTGVSDESMCESFMTEVYSRCLR